MTMRSNLRRLPVAATLAVAATALLTWTAVAYADKAQNPPPCSGKRLSEATCSAARPCAYPDCNDSVDSWPVDKCVGGVPGDNCVTNGALVLCAFRILCYPDWLDPELPCVAEEFPYANVETLRGYLGGDCVAP